jgi:hypothetical protein
VPPFIIQVHVAFPHTLQASISNAAYHDRPRSLGALLRASEDCPPRQHLFRHRVWWDNDNHANALDELVRSLQIWKDLEDYEGQRNLDEFQLFWPVGGEAMHPVQLLNALREMTEIRQVVSFFSRTHHNHCITNSRFSCPTRQTK